jgi:hypothetical protein
MTVDDEIVLSGYLWDSFWHLSLVVLKAVFYPLDPLMDTWSILKYTLTC